MTAEMKSAILGIKNEIPESQKVMGIEVYQAVIRDGIRTYHDFTRWKSEQAETGIIEWMP